MPASEPANWLVLFIRLCIALIWESLAHPLSTSYFRFDDSGHLTIERKPLRLLEVFRSRFRGPRDPACR